MFQPISVHKITKCVQMRITELNLKINLKYNSNNNWNKNYFKYGISNEK